jgi:HEAT repeat protein
LEDVNLAKLGARVMGRKEHVELVEKFRQETKQEFLKDPTKQEQFQEYLLIAGPMLAELTGLGYEIDTLDDLRHQGKPWKTALPVLLRWLPKIDDPSVKDSIVRGLSVPWIGNQATAELIDQFKKYAPILPKPTNLWVGNRMREISDEEKKFGPFFNLAWAIGNALSIVGVKGFEEQLIELCRNTKYGEARQMVVFGLGRLDSVEAEQTALALLDDEAVKIHAIIALGKMKSRAALVELEKLLTDNKATIRKEARKAITRITR